MGCRKKKLKIKWCSNLHSLLHILRAYLCTWSNVRTQIGRQRNWKVLDWFQILPHYIHHWCGIHDPLLLPFRPLDWWSNLPWCNSILMLCCSLNMDVRFKWLLCKTIVGFDKLNAYDYFHPFCICLVRFRWRIEYISRWKFQCFGTSLLHLGLCYRPFLDRLKQMELETTLLCRFNLSSV